MKRIHLALILVFVSVLSLNANPVDASLAQTAASKFFEAKFGVELRNSVPEMVYSEPNGAFFVFNTSANGFVIIAGDDAYRPVPYFFEHLLHNCINFSACF